MIIPFERDSISKLILVDVIVDEWHKLTMAIDTAATNTTIDATALRISEYFLKDSVGKVEIETANGDVEADIFEVNSLSLFSIEHHPFQIQVYNFIDQEESEYHGLLGLDFFEGRKFCIDLNANVITL